MMGILGAGCIMLGCLGVFYQLRLALGRRSMELISWLSAVRLLQSELHFGITPLPRLCDILAERCGGAAGDFWRKLGRELAARQDVALPEIWQDLLERERQNWHLQAEDWQALAELGAGLGKSGLGNQQRLLAVSEQRLLRLSDEAAARSARMERLLGGLGWCCGLLLICLWL
jgi:stage III sporulation protein AB